MAHRISRADRRAGSNNAVDPNRNICALAAANAFGVGDVQRYLHTDEYLFRAIRTRYSVRSVKSSCASTVGAARADMAWLAVERRDLIAFVVIVEGHVLVINRDGATIVDTAPRQRDRRTIRRIMGEGALICAFGNGRKDHRILGLRGHAIVRAAERLGHRHWRDLVGDLSIALPWIQHAHVLGAKHLDRFVLPLKSGGTAAGVWSSALKEAPIPVINTILRREQYTAGQEARYQRAMGIMEGVDAPAWPAAPDARLTPAQTQALTYWSNLTDRFGA